MAHAWLRLPAHNPPVISRARTQEKPKSFTINPQATMNLKRRFSQLSVVLLLAVVPSLAQGNPPLNPPSIGRTTPSVDSPVCYVDGITGSNPTIASCIAYLNALGVTGTGTIYSTIPEDITTQIFAGATPKFSGTIFLNNDLGTSSLCSQVAPFNCWVTEVPLILPPRLYIRGIGAAGTGTGISTNNGTAITFGSSFPPPIGFSGTIGTPRCTANTGHLASGTYLLEATLVNNLMGGASTPLTPGRGSVSSESMPVLCSGANGTITWTITGAPAVGTGFAAQEMAVYLTPANGASGTELEAGTAAHPVGCNTSVGTVDIDHGSCRLPTSGGGTTVTFTVTDAGTTGPPPPLVDTSNPMIVEGNGPDTGNANAVELRDLTLFGSPTGVPTPLSNEPSVALMGYTAQEQSGTSQVACYGAFTSACIYSGLNSNNSHHVGFNAGSSQGPKDGTFHTMILDGRMLTGGAARYVSDGTMAAHCAGCGGTLVNPAQILITGQKAFPSLSGIHTESAGGFGIQITNGASANIAGYDGFATGANHAVLQIDGAGSPSGGATGRVQATVHDDTGNAKLLIEDDTIPSGTGNCSAQTGGTNTAYCYTGSGYETAVYDNGLRQSPNIRTAQINDLLQGLPVFKLSGVASAVDFFTATNAATANPASISLEATGSDANVNINLVPAGSGAVAVLGPLSTTGKIAKYNNRTTAGLGVPAILAVLNQTGVSTANSGVAQTIFSPTVAGHYRVTLYLDQSAGCTTLGGPGPGVTYSIGWTDPVTSRSTPTTTVSFNTSASSTAPSQLITDMWAIASSAITVTDTYTTCFSGTPTYDQHITVEQLQ